jgi:hypothetical protein
MSKAGLLVSAEEKAIIQWIRVNSQRARHTTQLQIRIDAAETFKSLYHEDGSIRLY